MNIERLSTYNCKNCDCILINTAFVSFISIIETHNQTDHDVLCNNNKCCRRCGHLQKCDMSRKKVR